MSFKHATIVAVLFSFVQLSCTKKIDPKTADVEVRKLLEDVPGFSWVPSENSRMAYSNIDDLPVTPKDDRESRMVTLRIQKGDAFSEGNDSVLNETDQWLSLIHI